MHASPSTSVAPLSVSVHLTVGLDVGAVVVGLEVGDLVGESVGVTKDKLKETFASTMGRHVDVTLGFVAVEKVAVASSEPSHVTSSFCAVLAFTGFVPQSS